MARILAIDDQADHLEVLVETLQQYLPGHTIISTQSAKEGVLLAAKELPDVVLLDISMPEMNGYDVCRQLKNNETTCHIPIVMVTGVHIDVSSKVNALDCGADAFLVKPIKEIELVAQIKVALRLKSAEDKLRKKNQDLAQTVGECSNNLQKHLELLDSLMEYIPDTIYFKDRQSRFTRINQAQAVLLEIDKPEDATGKTDFDFFDEEVAQVLYEREQQIMNTGKSQLNVQETISHKNGSVSYYSSSKIALKNNKGEITGLVGISRDISEQIQTQQRLTEAKEKAEEADRLKTAFLANLSHEIRTPMNAIVGFAGLLVKPDLNQQKKQKYLEYINDGSEKLLTLINDIIDISRLETEQIKIDKVDCDINRLLSEMLLTFREERTVYQKEHLKLELNVPDRSKEFHIITDCYRLRQIITNLLKNALKFTESGKVEYGYTLKDANSLLFYVRDTGVGIPKSKQSVIFDRFRKLENKQKLYGGTGLGLSIAKDLIEILGGKIWVESTVNIGSTFYFILPCQTSVKEKEQTVNADSYADIDWSDKTILVAEDEKLNFIFIKEALIHTNINILRAKNGLEAIEISESDQAIDVILMDIKMPDVDGLVASMRIRKIRPHVPIIAQTAYALSVDREKIFQVGCNDYLSKPIRQSELLAVISKYINKPAED